MAEAARRDTESIFRRTGIHFVGKCFRRKLATYPKDGSIPFGLRDSTANTDAVERAIRERETDERQGQILCLTLLPASLRERAWP